MSETHRSDTGRPDGLLFSSDFLFFKEVGEGTEWGEKDGVMEKTRHVVMEKSSLEEKTSLSTQVDATGPEAWVSPPSTSTDNYNGPTTDMDITITTETSQVMVLFVCLTDCRRTSEGTDVDCLLTSRHAHSSRKYV